MNGSPWICVYSTINIQKLRLYPTLALTKTSTEFAQILLIINEI